MLGMRPMTHRGLIPSEVRKVRIRPGLEREYTLIMCKERYRHTDIRPPGGSFKEG